MTNAKKTDDVVMVPLKSLYVDPERFQLRDYGADQHKAVLEQTRAAGQLEDLISLVERGVKLQPMKVRVEEDGRYCVTSGHQRLAAYRRAKHQVAEVRVIVVQGSEADALLSAHSENAKTRLQYTRPQRTESAWQVFGRSPALRRNPVRGVSKSLSVSPGTVSNFRRAFEKLREEERREKGAIRMIPWRKVYMELRLLEGGEGSQKPMLAWDSGAAIAKFIYGTGGKEFALIHQQDPKAALTILKVMGIIGGGGIMLKDGVIVRVDEEDFSETLDEEGFSEAPDDYDDI